MPTSHESRVMASQNQMTFVSRIKLNSSRHTRVSTSKIARMFIHVKRHWMAQTYYMSSFQMNLLDLENYHSTVAISSITYQRSKHRTYDPFKCHSTACVCVCLQSTTECIPFTQLNSDTEQMIACICLCVCVCVIVDIRSSKHCHAQPKVAGYYRSVVSRVQHSHRPSCTHI